MQPECVQCGCVGGAAAAAAAAASNAASAAAAAAAAVGTLMTCSQAGCCALPKLETIGTSICIQSGNGEDALGLQWLPEG